jgi:hypothetical protein
VRAGAAHRTDVTISVPAVTEAPMDHETNDWTAFITNANRLVRATRHPAAVQLPIEGVLPSLGGATAWLNAPPLTAVGLRRTVVLIDCSRSRFSIRRAGLHVHLIEAARAELVGHGVDVSERFHDVGGCSTMSGPRDGSLARTDRRDDGACAAFSDPDGTGWLLHEVTQHAPRR